MKARYHRFTGDVPVVFVQDAKKFISSLGVQMNETSDKVSPDFMHEVDISGVKMLVFSEGMLRTMYGARVTPIIESHLALWKGTQRHPDNTLAAFKYAMSIAERFNRPKCHEILRRKLAEMTRIELPSMKETAKKRAGRPVEDILFKEDKVMHINFDGQMLAEGLSLADMKKKISSLVKKADDEVVRKVFSILNRDSGLYDDTIQFLTKIGIPTRNAQEIINFSLETGDFEAFAKYLKNRTLTLDDLDKAGSFITAVKKAIPGISDPFSSWLVNYKWPSSPAMGAGEAAVTIVLKDGNKPAKGDVGIGSRELEVKGNNGRIRGQKGIGEGLLAGQLLEKRFNEYMKKLPKDQRIDVPKAGGSDYQITKKDARPNKWFEHLVANGAMTQSQAVSVWQEMVKAIYINMNVSFVKKHIGKDGGIVNVTNWHRDMLGRAAAYYKKTEGFEAILHLNDKGQCRVWTAKDFPKLWDNVKVTSVPSFTANASTQGATYGITLR